MKIKSSQSIQMLKKSILFNFIISLSLFPAFAQQGKWLRNYLGTIGGSQAGMTLVCQEEGSMGSLIGKQISGTYFFFEKLQDYTIAGYSKSDRTIVIFRQDIKGDSIIIFRGTFPVRDPKGGFGGAKLDNEVIVGMWFSGKDKSGLPVYMRLSNATYRPSGEGRYAMAGVKNDSLFEKKVREFIQAVLRSDTTYVSHCVSFPIIAKIDGKRTRISNKSLFMKSYAKIFHAHLLDVLKTCIPHNMFIHNGSVMIGDGELWFDAHGKVIGINN
jgi:hypothetical protein